MSADVADLLARLVAIDSVNPALVPGGAGETEIAWLVAEWATEAGLRAEVFEETTGRPSVVVTAPGSGAGRTLLLCGHLDTVNVEGMTDPHVPRVEGDRMYGRGTYDMKSGLAAALLACREAAWLGLAGDVVVAAVADEEHSSLGVQEVVRNVRADAAIVTEPTELAIVVAHRGFAWFEVEVTGRAAHGSRPHLGVDAIVKTGPVLVALGALDTELEATSAHPLLGRGSVHASVIQGGEELSSYPGRCVVGVERRTLPAETIDVVEAELDALLDRCRQADPELVVARRTLLVRQPFEIAKDAELVTIVADSIRAVGGEARLEGASYWADAAFLASAGIPTVMFGPSGAGAHELEEWVSLADTGVVLRVLVDVARRVCG